SCAPRDRSCSTRRARPTPRERRQPCNTTRTRAASRPARLERPTSPFRERPARPPTGTPVRESSLPVRHGRNATKSTPENGLTQRPGAPFRPCPLLAVRRQPPHHLPLDQSGVVRIRFGATRAGEA